jgi:hypothetical protein
MDDSHDRPSELEKLIRGAPAAVGSGVRSGVRGVVLFLAAGMAYGTLIGKVEECFYDFPYVAFGLWLLTGILIFRACERGDI